MKKIRLILALMALLPFPRAFAQTGEILYTDFEPDPFLDVGYDQGTMTFDLDYDSIPDICMHFHWFGNFVVTFELYTTHSDFLLCIVNENDTISLAEDWKSGYSEANPDGWIYMGFRSEIDGDYYYGWFKLRPSYSEFNWYFDKFAYCTIPNYPLVWGQTDLVGLEENEEPLAFASVHPNPTNGIINITGENLRQAEVVNTLGQQVLGVQGKGNELRIDMAKLPAGVYLVNITDENGKKCVRKVVKE